MLEMNTLLILLLTTSCYALDMTEICLGKQFGEFVANPVDCSSYFVCSDSYYPTLKYCSHGLYFDELRKICNWPDQSNCRFETTSQPATTSSTIELSSSSTTAEIFEEIQTLPDSIFGAFSRTTGKKIDPMTDYNDQHIGCIHYGVYFLPHPRQCDKYFICAFGHIYLHQCDEGIRWNYLKQQCSITAGLRCYLGKNSTDQYQVTTVYRPSEVFPEVQTIEATSKIHTNLPTTKATARFPTTVATMTTQTLESQSTEAAETTTDESVLVTSDPGKHEMPKCPHIGNRAYISFPYDCRKYYICILGNPVLTSCPNGSYWNEEEQFCSSTKPLRCGF